MYVPHDHELGVHEHYGCLTETALMDLEDLEHNTRDGLHMASLAGTRTALGRRSSRASAGCVTTARPPASHPASPSA
ncbi:hypothetical protein [Streptomyces sp. NPDC012510]|jgi:hypothetical protein|uniref:hypothetical protein n=1 Tax=Streptomyces sp. NPDC012510 TaxID=3364838 RepID=UPI0036E056CB